MPLLVTKPFVPTLLSQTYDAVVKTQRMYARQRGVPWGISESAYSGVDFEATYQYRAFGVPGLGLKRGLAGDLVISPYSTMLALAVDAKHSLNNLKRLEQDGLRGEFGFYEAVDYTAERLGAEEKKHVIRSFLAHHQGMSLVSINNLLNHDIFQERFHTNPAVLPAFRCFCLTGLKLWRLPPGRRKRRLSQASTSRRRILAIRAHACCQTGITLCSSTMRVAE